MNNSALIQVQEITEASFKQADKAMAKISKVCTKGCNSCCHRVVDVFTWEEPQIYHYITHLLDRKEKRHIARNLRKWFKQFNSATRSVSVGESLSLEELRAMKAEFAQRKVACPFLLNNSCSIYPVRPLICRVHYESDDVQSCLDNPFHPTPEPGQRVYSDASAKFDPAIFPIAAKPLAYLVASEFDPSIEIKRVQAVVFDVER